MSRPSPNDPKYLEDTALAIKKLNDNGHQLGIILEDVQLIFLIDLIKCLNKIKTS